MSAVAVGGPTFPRLFLYLPDCAAFVKKQKQRCKLLLSDPLIPQQIMLCALNATCLAGKCFKSIPACVPSIAYAARCMYPLLSLTGSIRRCIKSVGDFRVVCRARCWSVLPWSAVDLFVTTSSLFLSLGSCVAAINIACSSGVLAAHIFVVMIPLGKWAFLIGFFRDVLTMLPDQQTADVFLDSMLSGFLPSSRSPSALYLRVRVSSQMWRKWNDIGDPVAKAQEARRMLEAISFYRMRENIQAMLFYPANWLTKCYPNSVLEAGIYLAFSMNDLRNKVNELFALNKA